MYFFVVQVWDFGFRVSGSGFGVSDSGFGFRVSGFGFSGFVCVCVYNSAQFTHVLTHSARGRMSYAHGCTSAETQYTPVYVC